MKREKVEKEKEKERIAQMLKVLGFIPLLANYIKEDRENRKARTAPTNTPVRINLLHAKFRLLHRFLPPLVHLASLSIPLACSRSIFLVKLNNLLDSTSKRKSGEA